MHGFATYLNVDVHAAAVAQGKAQTGADEQDSKIRPAV
jgi:hypothetical protein